MVLLKHRDHYLRNQSFLKKHLLKVYTSFSEKMDRSVEHREKANSLNKQCIIFSSRKGFYSVFSVKEIGDIKEVRLARPGFGWDEEAREFLDPEIIKTRSFIKVMNLCRINSDIKSHPPAVPMHSQPHKI